MKHISILIISAFILYGCALKEAPPIQYYTFQNAHVPTVHQSRYRHSVLKVSYPQTLKEKMTDKILFSYSMTDRGVYLNSQWSNNLQKLIEGYIIVTLQESTLFKAVLPYASTAGEDFRLESMIYDFSHHIRGDKSYAVVSIQFALIDTRSGKLLKTKRFSYREDTPSVNAKGYVSAVNKILDRLGNDLVHWLENNEKQ